MLILDHCGAEAETCRYCLDRSDFFLNVSLALEMPGNQAKYLLHEPSANCCCLCFHWMSWLRSGWLYLANVTELTELPSLLSYLFSFALFFLLFAWNSFNTYLLHHLYWFCVGLLLDEIAGSVISTHKKAKQNMLLRSAKQLEAASYDRFPKNKFFIHSFLKNYFPFFQSTSLHLFQKEVAVANKHIQRTQMASPRHGLTWLMRDIVYTSLA